MPFLLAQLFLYGGGPDRAALNPDMADGRDHIPIVFSTSANFCATCWRSAAWLRHDGAILQPLE
jgi:hypothetical protein